MAVLTIGLFCFFSSISSSMQNTLPRSFWLRDRMGWSEKLRIMQLSEGLLKESLLHMRQIMEVRNEHDTLVSYNIGMLMGRIREKFRFMSDTYRELIDTYQNASWAKPPGIRSLRPLHFIVALERMHYLELEIDKLVDVMVDEATRDLIVGLPMVGQTPATSPARIYKGGKRAKLRSGTDIVREEREKNLMRQKFLMKKLGNPTNMTTAKKRFLRNWPVEDSWTLDKYNQDYK